MEEGTRVTHIKKITKYTVKIHRRSKGSKIKISVDFRNKKSKIKTSSSFLNELLENLSFYGDFGLNVEVEGYNTYGTIAEIMGKGLREIFEKRTPAGNLGSGRRITSDGDITSMISISMISGRPDTSMTMRLSEPSRNILEYRDDEMVSFLDGFCKGMESYMKVIVSKTEDKKRLWKLTMRSLGESINDIFQEVPKI